MRVRISQVDPSLPLPIYATEGATAFDLYCRLDTTVPPNDLARIPANVIVAVPDGYTLVIALRSGTPYRLGLSMPNGVGIIDRDYCGPQDEIQIQVYNFTPDPVRVARGERVAQGLFVPVPRVTWEVSDPVRDDSRSGFGSTG